jgi:DNA-binding transcriptional regulator YiaG
MTREPSAADLFEGRSIGELIVEGLEEFSETLRSAPQEIPQRFNAHTIVLDLAPTPYDAELVQRTRRSLGASQTVFARFLGVSVQAVRAWEQGVHTPRDASCRLMDEIRHDPAYWQARLRQLAVKVKTTR